MKRAMLHVTLTLGQGQIKYLICIRSNGFGGNAFPPKPLDIAASNFAGAWVI